MRILALMLLAAPAGPDEMDQRRYDALLNDCYYGAEDRAALRACIGLITLTCQDEEDGGGTTLGISMCNHAEREAWDKLLNAEYRETMGWALAMDADDEELFPEFANRENSLREAQRAWIVFRDAECGLDYAVWGAGSMRHIAGTACLAELTARRTLDLRSKRTWIAGEEE